LKKASEILKGVYDFSYVKYCPHCRKKVKGYKTYISDNQKVKLIRPIFNCDCIERLEQEKVEKEKKRNILELMENSHIDKEFKENDFPFYHEKLKSFYDDLGWIKLGGQLLIYGSPGNHKTGHVTTIMKKAIKEKQLSCAYYRASELPKLAINYSHVKKDCLQCDLLVLDNFAKEESEKFGGIIFDILDRRIHNKKACILILNFEDDSRIEKIYQKPMASRINAFKQIPMTGRDKREDMIYGEEN